MRYRAEHREEAKERLLEAAGRGFRRQGYGGIGVDGLAREAGVTSGAFYGHFKSKDEAFEAAAVAGLNDLLESIVKLQEAKGVRWAGAFIKFYLGERLHCRLDNSCALQSLTPEAMRASHETRSAYGAALEKIARQMAGGLEGKSESVRLQKAWSLMALLSGGVTMARSIASREVQEAVASQLKRVALGLL